MRCNGADTKCRCNTEPTFNIEYGDYVCIFDYLKENQEQHSFKQIGDIFGKSISWAAWWHNKAIKKLNKRVEAGND